MENDKQVIINHQVSPASVNDDGKLDNDNPEPMKRKPLRRVIIEPVVFLFAFAMVGTIPITQQYIYSRFGNQSADAHHNATSRCDEGFSADVGENDTNPVQDDIANMQTEASLWGLYVSIATSIPSLLVVLPIGSLSDNRGRRPALLLPIAACTIKAVIGALVIFLRLPLPYLLVGAVVEGLGGTWSALIMTSFAYVADTSTHENRAVRITIAAVALGLASASSQAAMGFLIRVTGFLVPYLVTTFTLVICLLYAMFFVPETLTEQRPMVSPLKQIKEIVTVFKITDRGRRAKLLLLYGMMVIVIPQQVAVINVFILFVMRPPICWNSVSIGIYGASNAVVTQICAGVGVKLMKMRNMKEMWIALTGLISGIISNVLTGFAWNTLTLYLVTLVGCLDTIPSAMIRAAITHLVQPNELGKVFGCLACLEIISTTVGSMLATAVYNNTYHFMPGMVFVVVGFLLAVAAILDMIYLWYGQYIKNEKQVPVMFISSTSINSGEQINFGVDDTLY